MNRWKIPPHLETEVLARDSCCVYCGIDFRLSHEGRGARPSWEHIINDAGIVTSGNIARCCISCNASKGTKDIGVWLESAYCKRKGITRNSVAQVVKDFLSHVPAQAFMGAQLVSQAPPSESANHQPAEITTR